MNSSNRSGHESGIEAVTPAEPAAVSVSVSFPKLRRRVLIFGVGPLAQDLCQVILSKRASLTQVVGFLDKGPTHVGERLVNPSIIGTYDQLFEIAERYQVQTVAICIEDRRAALPVQTLLDMKAMGLDVIDGYHLYEEESGRLSIDHLKPSALIFSTGFRRRMVTMISKRLVDLLISSIGLIALVPLFLFLGILIKLDSPGSVFYRQMRVGLQGRPYMIWKFRSMREDAERSGARWASAEDPRISRIGRWLRQLRLDELPQLVNVLKGEMSLIGPRPERPVFVQVLRNCIPYYDLRHTVRPGITGWAQTRFRYGASAEDSHIKLQYDLYYVKNLSLALDVHILIKTARVMLFGEGAR